MTDAVHLRQLYDEARKRNKDKAAVIYPEVADELDRIDYFGMGSHNYLRVCAMVRDVG